jgi:hypothetical protein
LPPQVAAATRLNQVARNYNLKFEPDEMREVVRGFLEQGSALHQEARSAARPVPKSGEKKREGEDHLGGEREVNRRLTAPGTQRACSFQPLGSTGLLARWVNRAAVATT